MHILHITPYYAPAYAFGGVVSAVEGMAGALHRRGHTLTVLTTDALSRHERWTDAPETVRDGVRVVRVRNVSPWLRGALNLSSPAGMGRALRRLLPGVDIVHLHEFRTVENLLTLRALPPALPVVLSPHGTLTLATGRSRLKQAWDRLLSPRLARRIQHLLALTQQEAADALAVWQSFGGQLPPFSVVPNGIDPAQFERLPSDRAFRQKHRLRDDRVILFLGRLHARKGVLALAQAFLQVNLPGTRLVFAGPDEGMRGALLALQDERIVLTGYLNAAERLEALAAADVFVLPATGEGLSMAALEALAAGLPVILSPGCNLPEVAAAEAGLIVLPQPAALAAALQGLWFDADLRRRMSARARHLAQTAFTWDSVAQRLEAAYQKLL
jgi:glycosyltransferase involved in cell wall biosynthesis